MASTIGRGLVAGAFGTVLLNAATYLDMLLTGRPASDTPERSLQASAGRMGIDLPDDHRLGAAGALGGLATGIGVGVLASGARRAGVRLPAPLGAVATGAAAMVLTNGPMAMLGVSDPREWSAADWTRDVVPHLAYGVGVRYVLDRVEPPEAERATKRPRAGRELLVRSLSLGAAAGARSTLGLAVPALATGNPVARVAAGSAVLSELVGDKMPWIPNRLQALPATGRILAGAAGGATLARREGVASGSAVVAGTVGAAAGTVAGAWWRDVASRRGSGWQGALVEDAVALALTAYAVRR